MSVDIEEAVLELLRESSKIISDVEEVIVGFENGIPFAILKRVFYFYWRNYDRDMFRKVAIFLTLKDPWEPQYKNGTPVVYVKYISSSDTLQICTFRHVNDLGDVLAIFNNEKIVQAGEGRTPEHIAKIKEWI